MDSEITGKVEEKQVRRRKDKAKAAADQRRNDLVSMMRTPLGRRFINRLLVDGYVIGCTTFSLHSDRASAFNEGKRVFALAIFNDIMQHCAEEYIMMLRECKEDPND